MPETESQLSAIGTVDAGDTRQEVHILADSHGPEQKHSEPLAQRENMYDEQGRIVDVRFTQHGNSRTVKELLPGTYTIEFIQDERSGRGGVALPMEDKIVVNDSPVLRVTTLGKFGATEKVIPVSQAQINQTLLHEAGHMVDDREHLSTYQQLETERDKAGVIRYLLLAKKAEVMQHAGVSSLDQEVHFLQLERIFKQQFPDETVTQETLSDAAFVMAKMTAICQKMLEANKKRLLPHQFEEVERAFEEAREYLTEEHTLEVVDARAEEMRQTEWKYAAKLHALQERNAEALSLKAYRELKRQGITVSSQEEFLSSIQSNLAAYEYENGKYLDPTDHRIVKGVAPLRRSMQEPARV